MLTTLVSLFVVVVLAIGGTATTTYAAQDDLPGDTLYPVKTFTEQVRLTLASDANDLALYQEFVDQRLQEALQLADSRRLDDLETGLARYEIQLSEMNQTLARLAEKDPQQAEVLAARVQAMLEAQLQSLEQLSERVRQSDSARATVEDAMKRSREHAGLEFFGIVESISDTAWQISGRQVGITASTEIKGAPGLGSMVKVHAYLSPDESLIAREIELVEAGEVVTFTGYVDQISDQSWTVNGQVVWINPETDVRNEITTGDWVIVKALLAEDGTLTALVIHLPGYEDAPGQDNENDDSGNGNGNDNDDDDSGNGNGNQNGNDDDDDDPGNGNGNQNGNDDDDDGSDNGNGNQNGNDDDDDNSDNGNGNQNGNDDDDDDGDSGKGKDD